jgi:hypothetical protein
MQRALQALQTMSGELGFQGDREKTARQENARVEDESPEFRPNFKPRNSWLNALSESKNSFMHIGQGALQHISSISGTAAVDQSAAGKGGNESKGGLSQGMETRDVPADQVPNSTDACASSGRDDYPVNPEKCSYMCSFEAKEEGHLEDGQRAHGHGESSRENQLDETTSGITGELASLLVSVDPS